MRSPTISHNENLDWRRRPVRRERYVIGAGALNIFLLLTPILMMMSNGQIFLWRGY
jgi:hypothetical protein